MTGVVLIRIAWNLAVGIWLVTRRGALRLPPLPSAGAADVQPVAGEVELFPDERQWLRRFLLGLVAGLLGNAVIAGVELIAVAAGAP